MQNILKFIFFLFPTFTASAQQKNVDESIYFIQDSVSIPTKSGINISAIIVRKKANIQPLPVILFYTTYYQGKDDKSGADDTILGTRQCDREEHPGLGRAQRIGGFVQAGVRQRQSRQQDHQGMWKAVENFRHHDAERPVHRHAKHPLLEQPLIAEQVDHRNRRQQRGGQDGNKRQRLKQAFPAHATAL